MNTKKSDFPGQSLTPSLSAVDRKILAKIQFASHLTIREFATREKLPERTVRYTLKKLESRGIIVRTTCLNLFALGQSSALVYFSTGRLDAQVQKNLLATLSKCKRVVWLAELGGEYQYGMAVSVRSPIDLQTFLSGLSDKYIALFREKVIAFQSGIALFPRKYFVPEISGADELYSSGIGSKRASVDDFDVSIIGALCDDPNASLRQIAQLVGRSHSAVEERLAKLKRSGVIVGDYFKVEGAPFGYQTYKLFVTTKGMNPALSESVREFCRRHRYIVYMIECIGTWDFEIGVEAISPQDVVPVVQELSDHFSDSITLIKTVPVFRLVKFQYHSLRNEE